MMRLILTGIVCVSVITGCSNKLKQTTKLKGAAVEAQRLKLKNSAFCSCLNTVYPGLEQNLNDGSAAGYFETSAYGIEAFEIVDSLAGTFAAKELKSKYNRTLGIHKCLDFYNSKELEKLIHELDTSLQLDHLPENTSTKIIAPIVGGIYVNDSIVNNGNLSQDAINTIVAIRIDTSDKTHLLVTYRFGREAHMPGNFEYNSTCECFTSQDEMLFGPDGKRREHVTLKVESSKNIELVHGNNASPMRTNFVLTYIDTLSFAARRDPYRAEDGFKLSEE